MKEWYEHGGPGDFYIGELLSLSIYPPEAVQPLLLTFHPGTREQGFRGQVGSLSPSASFCTVFTGPFLNFHAPLCLVIGPGSDVFHKR